MDIMEIIEIIGESFSSTNFLIALVVQFFVMMIIYSIMHKKHKLKIKQLKEEVKGLKNGIHTMQGQRDGARAEMQQIERNYRARIELMRMDTKKGKKDENNKG